MKKQINPTIKAHLIRGAFYLLLLLAVCAIPFALAQRHAIKQSAAQSAGATAARFGVPVNPDTAHVSAMPQSQALSPKDLMAVPTLPQSQLGADSNIPSGQGYTFTMMSGCADFVPGTTDTTNHCDDCATLVALPFNYTLYDQSFNMVNVGSNGHLTFGVVSNSFNPSCIPITGPTYAVGPYWTDQCTGACTGVTCSGCGIFTSTSGTAPNRIFNIEWRTAYYNSGGDGVPLNYEVRLYEGQTFFDVIYETVNTFTPPASRNLSVGVQQNTTNFTLVGCDSGGGQNPPVAQCTTYRYTLGGGGSPTPTATATPTGSPTGCCVLGTWGKATTGPPTRYRAGGCTDGTYVYVYGGSNASAQYLNDLWRWDPATETWTQLANMPTGKSNIQGAYWNGKIYVPGGYIGSHITENAIYDIATNMWTTGAPLPAAQSGQQVAFGNKIYNFGGNPGPQSTVTIYDIATNMWTTGASMPVATTYARATVAGNFAYYAGGITTVTTNAVYRYDFAANTWATMTPLQTARTSEELMTSPDGCKLYAVMGGDASFFTGYRYRYPWKSMISPATVGATVIPW